MSTVDLVDVPAFPDDTILSGCVVVRVRSEGKAVTFVKVDGTNNVYAVTRTGVPLRLDSPRCTDYIRSAYAKLRGVTLSDIRQAIIDKRNLAHDRGRETRLRQLAEDARCFGYKLVKADT